MTALELDHVTVRVNRRELLSDVSFRAHAGEFVALVGPNGAGKTTLLRTALGLVAPLSGRVLLDGAPAASLGARARAERLAWLPQQLSPSEPLTALEVVMAARYRFDETPPRAAQACLAALDRVRARELAERRIDRLSGGERQRVALAALLAQEARVLLADEPANHLDPGHQAQTYRLLGELWREGFGVVCVTHDVNLLAHARSPETLRVAGLAGGKLRFDTHYSDPELHRLLSDLFGVAMGTFQSGGRRFLVPLTPEAEEAR